MDPKQRIHVMTLANSIIGVSILAMPFCFKQCGIVLSILLLLFSSILCRLACHFLLKSAIKSRLRTFEYLAYHVFGSVGKLFVEIGMIGFLLGTCVAFFVVMGDLSPQIIAQVTEIKSMETLRTSILVALALFCVLPLGLLRNVDSLSSVCIATIVFYASLVFKIFMEAAPQLLAGNWYEQVDFWKPSGVLQCIPIFSMALFCQTQLFEIYQAIPNASLEKMNEVVKIAVNICTSVYIFVGVFGYIAVCHKPNFSGNILMDIEPSTVTETMKLGFVLSVAFSFPLIIFPCRASLYSLLYRPTYTGLHDSTNLYIPEGKFRFLTMIIISVSLIIGILIPNIELVLGLVGSTIGIMICVIFPATCFICLTDKNTNERVLAQIMLAIGIGVMVLGTYANLYAIDHIEPAQIDKLTSDSLNININIKDVPLVPMQDVPDKNNLEIAKEMQIKIPDAVKEIRHEPVQPEEPVEVVESKDVKVQDVNLVIPETELKVDAEPQKILEEIEKQKAQQLVNEEKLKAMKKIQEIAQNAIEDIVDDKINDPMMLQQVENDNVAKKQEDTLQEPNEIVKNDETLNNNQNQKEENVKPLETINNSENLDDKKDLKEQVDSEAIKKEDQELEKGEIQKENLAESEKLMQQKQQLVEKNQKIREEIEEQKAQQLVNEEKLKAVKKIQGIAQKAIEDIVDDKIKDTMVVQQVENDNVAQINDIVKQSDMKETLEILQKQKNNNNQEKHVESKENEVINRSSDVKAPLSYQLGLQNNNGNGLNKSTETKNANNPEINDKSQDIKITLDKNEKNNENIENIGKLNIKIDDKPDLNVGHIDNKPEINKNDANYIADDNKTLNLEILKKNFTNFLIHPNKETTKNKTKLENEEKLKILGKIDDNKKNRNEKKRNLNVKKVVEKKDEHKNDENLALRRDILSKDYNNRRKREIKEENCEKSFNSPELKDESFENAKDRDF